MSTYRDSYGKALTDYPRPSLAVDTAVLSMADGVLSVLLVADDRDGATGVRRLPGTFLHEGEQLADAVARSLADKAGIAGLAPVQLHVFDALDRDSRGWVVSVAHLVAVPAAFLGGTELAPVSDAGPLAYDHAEILELAVARLRADYDSAPDPWRLLGDAPFTLLELERLHRAVNPERPGSKDTFRRLMEPQLVDTGEMERGTIGKPARLFVRK